MSPKKGDRPVTADAVSKGNITEPIVPPVDEDVKIDFDANNMLTVIRVGKGVPTAEIIDIVRKLYPKFDKTLLSKCEHPEYGVQIRTDAETALISRFAPERLRRRSHGNKEKPNRIYARVSETVYGLLQQRITHTGQTMQDYIEEIIINSLTGGENNDPNAR